VNGSALAGLALMVGSEAATLAGIEPFASWNTPIAWTGFILFADGIVWRVRGSSWIRSAPREFAFLAVVSIPLWLVFELYNLQIHNWFYVGLPENALLRGFGYAWSFATIWPAIFEGAELIGVWRQAGHSRESRRTIALQNGRFSPTRIISLIVGAAMLIWPLIWPSPYLAAPVWLGFILMLDPINEQLGGESLAADLVAGHDARAKNLVLSGFLCGILWEFWNYWARAKWHYTIPIMEKLKIFEMPVPGYLGFPAFALECFTMYVFARMVCASTVSGFKQAIGPGRPIAL
jgi:hypothetical protein